MSLANIESLLLHLAIDPYFLTKESTSELRSKINATYLDLASKIDRKSLEEFSIEVASKRLNSTPLPSSLARTRSYMNHTNQDQLLLHFISENKMYKNEWIEKIDAFYEFIIQHTDDLTLREVARFEHWLYKFESLTEKEQTSNFTLSTNVSLYKSFLPATSLIEINTVEEHHINQLKESFNTINYILAKNASEDIDLFEIDACYYEILQRCNKSRTQEELLLVIKEISNTYNYTHKKSIDIFDEFIELKLLNTNK